MDQVLSEYFGFPCQSSFSQLLHNHHHHLGLVQYANSGRSTKWTQSHPSKSNDKIQAVSERSLISIEYEAGTCLKVGLDIVK
jgi:hypothetical protein